MSTLTPVATVTIPVGRRRTPSAVPEFGAPEQRQAVMEIVARPDFAYAAGNPFDQSRGAVAPPFPPIAFTWVDRAGGFHTVSIGRSGRVVREVECDRYLVGRRIK